MTAVSLDADPVAESARGSDYAQLSRLIREAGLLERRPGRYVLRVVLTVALMVVGWTAFFLVGDSWWQLAVAVFLGVTFAQFGFLGHDAGHRQISSSRKTSYIIGVLLGDLGIGLCYGWWVGKHNRHHAHPNTEGADPDVMLSVLAMTPSQASRSRGMARALYRWQAYLFFPLLLGEGFGLHASGLRSVATRSALRQPVEPILMTVHIVAYLAAVFIVLPPVKAIVFICVQQGLFGLYMGASFAPNHKGMPILEAGDDSDFLRRQVLTSRNVRGGRLTDLALGGLNYQIEHHLFPSMPRPNLRHSQPLVREFCEQHGVPYSEASLFGSYAQAVRYLNTVGRQLSGQQLPA
jgi:fatty acid desaturase